MNFIFLGMKHCGKSTAANIIAELYGFKEVDTDDLMADLYLKEFDKHYTAKAIFSTHGETFFKDFEYKAVMNFLQNAGKSPTNYVIALGGATPLNGDIMEQIEQQLHPIKIYLKADPRKLFTRVVRNGPSRFSEYENPQQSFLEFAAKREPIYEKNADVIIDTEALNTKNLLAEKLKETCSKLLHK